MLGKQWTMAGSALICGFIFGMGLLISGMANPAKVLAFLDLFGAWDPSLALVMAGATGVAAVGFILTKKRSASLLGEPLRVPNNQLIDARLLLGSLTFGVGWGLAGFCPGPALVALGAAEPKALLFGAAMLLGMLTFDYAERKIK
jgi:uncharacterized membrane protein YedE/YeeE